MLTEAFRVILMNGVEAVNKNKAGRNLWIDSRLRPDSMLEVSIRDDGVGIKPENAVKIFEMGWSTKKGKGMGFGLFWTRDYIEGLGGHITVDSSRKKGAAFIITLPENRFVDT